MAVNFDQLAMELKRLRKGPAVRHPELLARLGPQTRLLCGITAADGCAAARQKLATTVQALLEHQREELVLAVTAALALLPEADHRKLSDRERWLAGRLNCNERTARRRVGQAFAALAQLAAEHAGGAGHGRGNDGWQVQAVRALLRLDGGGAELTEHRTVRMVQDGVGEIVTRFSLPRADAGGQASHELHAEVLHGGRIRRRDRVSDEHFRYLVELPRLFHSGEIHEYVIRFQIPPGQPTAPHYVLLPLVEVKSLHLTVRFDQRRLPSSVWRLDGVPPRVIEKAGADADLLHPDRFGELQSTFRGLRQGFGYGIRWQFPAQGAA